ncbi:chymotrypsin-like elastase family member 1 [Alosa alosa]|uniref:chymotrypsin-like elastase family member 1 n=1 Tax=Alosa alosa TaxID=278164 RepID=UPI0020154242|nr:chymotrypsin-like elastase family member 1 [Alosa alosa]
MALQGETGFDPVTVTLEEANADTAGAGPIVWLLVSMILTSNDIALVRLYTYATLNSYVKLATLPSANRVLSSGTCYVTGWGRTSSKSALSNVLRYSYLPIVSRSTCTQASWWGCSLIKSSMICAGGTTSRSACYGDSGGPLNCYIGRRWVVHGVTSFISSRGCNTVRKPSVFTRVSAFTSWINRVELTCC